MKTICLYERESVRIGHAGADAHVLVLDAGRARRGRVRVGCFDATGLFTFVKGDAKNDTPKDGRLGAAYKWCNQWEAEVKFFEDRVRVRSSFHGIPVVGEAKQFLDAVERAAAEGERAVERWDRRAKRDAVGALARAKPEGSLSCDVKIVAVSMPDYFLVRDRNLADYIRLNWDQSVSTFSPVVNGTFVSVHRVIQLIVEGWPWSDILRSYPELDEADIRECLRYATESQQTNGQ